MKTHFVADGECRLRTSEGFKARERELRESIAAGHSEQLSRAGIWRACMIRLKIFFEYRRERRLLLPSDEALYFTPR